MTSSERPAIAASMQELVAAYAGAGIRPRGVVMTMGALHEGHADLMTAARERVGSEGHVTVTIFVNPLQFGVGEDLDLYPRTLDDDVSLCADRGVDLIFTPTPDVIYPNGDPAVTVHPGPLGDLYEGRTRKDHFVGVLTVVNKLLNLTDPDFAMFGEKDYQQLTLVKAMARDLDMRAQIVPVPTTRADDGLALSSRNKYLGGNERDAALAISRALAAAREAAEEGGNAEAVRAAASAILTATPGLRTEYVVVTDPMMGPAPERGEARVIVTAYVGSTRLLDNSRVDIRPAGGSDR